MLNFSVKVSKLDKSLIKCSLPLLPIALLPFAAISGNAISDIFLVITIIVFFFFEKQPLQKLCDSWLIRISTTFWIWIVFSSLLSNFPKNSLQDSLPWIRFPIYAIIISYWLSDIRHNYKFLFYYSTLLATIIELSVMTYQFFILRFSNSIFGIWDMRLYGTFAKPMAGWFIVSFSMIVILMSLEEIRLKNLSNLRKYLYIFLILFCSFGMVATGEIVNSVAFFCILTLYFFMRSRFRNMRLMSMISISVVIMILIFILFWIDKNLFNRFVYSFSHRLPWQEGSDYYAPFRVGYEFAINNLLFGIGPKNTFLHCEHLSNENKLELFNLIQVNNCPWHPHNLYLQIFSESGWLGLLIFLMLCIYLIFQAFRGFYLSKFENNIPLSIFLITLFPVQTYSQAFGQSRNFFLWTILGFSIAILRQIFISNNRKIPL